MHAARARASQSRGLRPALRRAIAAEDDGDQHAAATGDQAAVDDPVVASGDAPRLTKRGSVTPRKRDNNISAPVGAPPAPRSGWTRSQGHHPVVDAITRTPPGRT